METKKICLITGANSGIGFEASKQIADKGYHVIMACRNPSKGQIALDAIKQEKAERDVVLKIVDLSLQESIQALCTDLKSSYQSLDVVIHNAAIFDISQKKAKHTTEGIESIWATNHLGPVLFNQLMEDQLSKSDDARIILVASKGLLAKPRLTINFTDPEAKKRKFSVVSLYYQSKLAQIMYTQWLAEKLASKSIKVNISRVPAVRVDISKFPNMPNFLKKLYLIKSRFSMSPADMAESYTHLACSTELATTSGKYFNEKNQVVPFTKYQRNKTEINKLMELTWSYLQKKETKK